ncbi:4-(cytidine 5'-diphospho)-2-C-methyl-D-erythritol kinase [Rubrivivax gelatinosus]|uniref:4-diphosphocytidyl-2-C-methyl-D-erythritol kinase n=1 Tax=Rubrivivax gelatinosus TaxID=28068 RepID=A0ABS1DY82_RUBGE|nr:4-(cytidine 5'-diphospho)-2-C-methyl-D-erythritol kinase [Rubrivivax gelatinosus]MBK1714468.1 4-(cytidine 5'-diphospho)-2-C-methyl-D-erythritol kinase [Rubrivivax gelatinosus]
MTLRSLLDVPAPAKLNLFLHIVGRRADGYHLLQSPFVLIDWADTLHFERRDDGRIERHDLGAALPPEDLCLRAARALQAASGTALGVDISIMKTLPAGAGMGGGSSDAATVLLALNRLWALDWPRERLLALGATLGADVPFFVGGRNAFVEGIGEQLTPLQLPRQWYAVVKPPAGLATKEIFSHPLLKRDTSAIVLGSLADDFVVTKFSTGYGSNDMQPPAQDRCSDVAKALQFLEARFGNSRMTGSGSAVFARAGTGDQPVATFQQAELAEGWVGRMCRSLEQHPLVGWARD